MAECRFPANPLPAVAIMDAHPANRGMASASKLWIAFFIAGFIVKTK
jgi:hypothetical protein